MVTSMFFPRFSMAINKNAVYLGKAYRGDL